MKRISTAFAVVLMMFLAAEVSGQQLFTIHGMVSRTESSERVAQAIIKDTRTGQVMMSDELGGFTIPAALGDTLLFRKDAYADEKVLVTSKNDLSVSMQPLVQLATVTITGKTTKQELNEVMAGYRKDGTFYYGRPPALSFLSNPITGFYELFGKTPREARRFAQFSKDEEQYAYIRRRYNLRLVKQVTKAPDSTAQSFLQFYTPSYEDLKGWSDYDLIKEVQKQFAYFEKNRGKIVLHGLYDEKKAAGNE